MIFAYLYLYKIIFEFIELYVVYIMEFLILGFEGHSKLYTVKSLIESGLYLEFVILNEDCNRVGTVFESGLYFLGLFFENVFTLCSRHFINLLCFIVYLGLYRVVHRNCHTVFITVHIHILTM